MIIVVIKAINTFFICYKCAIPINEKIGKYYICRDCFNTVSKLYYKNKIKPNRIPIKRKKITYQKDYTLPNGEIIKVNITIKKD